MKIKNDFPEKELPAANQRMKILIDHFAGGSVKLFSEQIGLSSSQKLNRIFNIDQRNGEYPEVSSDILTCIANMFSNVDINWVLTGREEMLRNLPKPATDPTGAWVYMIDKMEEQSKIIGRQEKEIEVLLDIVKNSKSDVKNSTTNTSDSEEEDAPSVSCAAAV